MAGEQTPRLGEHAHAVIRKPLRHPSLMGADALEVTRGVHEMMLMVDEVFTRQVA